MDESEILSLLANDILNKNHQQPFDRILVEIQRQENFVGFCCWSFLNNEKNNLHLHLGFHEAKAIMKLYTITQTQPPIHKDWNKAKLTLYPDGKVDMEYIWDAEWQAKIDKYNAEAEKSKNGE
ncbi:MAG: hypothetical protein J6Y82_04915 [Bacteroidales bacterium]|nr:hypothetical protein [Bacteroidales bacterium]